ncbi:MAG: hypothetical protein K2H52_16465 [Lachnospiraceae bacterium]|nr:hypothetical protein [Lachnospiraceae bacterium]MDE6184851.1 hypothetical protein [Lachnospiraceae bacterium]
MQGRSNVEAASCAGSHMCGAYGKRLEGLSIPLDISNGRTGGSPKA